MLRGRPECGIEVSLGRTEELDVSMANIPTIQLERLRCGIGRRETHV